MRKIKLVIGLLFGLLFLNSCSSDDKESTVIVGTQLEEAIVQNGPWTFHHYELISIVDAGNSMMTQEQIEDDMNERLAGFTLVFNEDGTGETLVSGEEGEVWNWSIIDGNKLKVLYPGNYSDLYSNVTIENSQLKMEGESVTFDSNVLFEVEHYGRIVFE